MAETIVQVVKKIVKRVVCLYRVSTVGQVEKDDIPMQKQFCREFCQRQEGWEIVRELSEKGVSGFKVSAKKRDKIQEIQRMALAGEFDILPVFMFDRLGRKDDETPFVVEWFVNQGIEVWSAMEGQQRFDTHVDKLLNYIRYWQASGESIKTSARVKTRIGQLTEQGYYTGGIVPYGYRLVNKGRTNKRNKEVPDLAIDPNEAEVVKVIFQKYVCEGYGGQRICRYLSEQGYHNRKGGKIATTSINRILKNPLYIGILCNGESKSEEVLTELQIIDVELFERAQTMLQERAKPQEKRDVPLTTRGQSLLVRNIFCGHCGRRLTLTTCGQRYRKKDGTVVTKSYARYLCSYNTQHPGECSGPASYGTAKLDSLVDQIIRLQFERIQTAPPQDLIQEQRGREVEVAKAKLNLLNIQYQQKQKDYRDLQAETLKVIRGASRLNVDLLNSVAEETTAHISELEQQIAAAETELRELVSGADQVKRDYAQLMNWATLYDNCSFEAKKMIAAQFIKAVRVKRSYELEIEFNVSFSEFQRLYLEPEKEGEHKRGPAPLLAFEEKTRQAV